MEFAPLLVMASLVKKVIDFLKQITNKKWNDALGEFRPDPAMTGRYRPHCPDDPAPGEEPPLWRAYSAGWANRFVTEACPTCWPRDAALAAEQE